MQVMNRVFVLLFVSLIVYGCQGCLENIEVKETLAISCPEAGYTPISDADGLRAIEEDLGGFYCLTGDITMHRNSFEPIGSVLPDDNPFQGKLDGNGKKIIDLTIESVSYSNTGLFAKIGIRGEVKDLTIDEPIVKGHLNVGALAGSNGGTISNVTVTGTDNSYVDGSSTIGGLVGKNERIIEGCAVQIKVIGENAEIGGLVGENQGTITNSYAMIQVVGNNMVGGFVGWNNGALSASIEQSFASGLVIGKGEKIGGFVGANNGKIKQSFSRGNVN